VDKNLYVVYEYYPNGKVKLVTNSKTNDINLKYQGRYIGYFPNGRKKNTGSFMEGKPAGHEAGYYPNGKAYYTKDYLPDGNVYFDNCRDSTGKVLTENGNGEWIQYNDDFTKVIAEGTIENGKKEGEWHGSVDNNVDFKSLFHQGDILNSDTFDRPGADSAFTKVDVDPEFPGGGEAFGKFLGHTIRYPRDAIIQGIQGKIFISFIIETDGTLTNLKVFKGVDKIIDDEALRVMKLSPPWNPGLVNSKRVRVAYKVPISFALSN
jgi:TonB family protein